MPETKYIVTQKLAIGVLNSSIKVLVLIKNTVEFH